MRRIAILASGSGTNAENIIKYFSTSTSVKVDVVMSNNVDAYALCRARNLGVDTYIFDREMFSRSNVVAEELKRRGIDLIVLAGFLWLVPPTLTKIYADRIINIHPALLPKYGGRGMYGDNVHRAVVEASERYSGITVHKVNEEYDSGDIIAQYRIEIAPTDKPEDVATKVHRLEYDHYPRVIEEYVESLDHV